MECQLIQYGLRLPGRTRPQRGQDSLADQIDDMSQTTNEALPAMEPHQGLDAKHVILIIICLEELGV